MEEIQPLGYTEAKNIEEHKRIIDKINEMLVPVNSIEDDVGTVLESLTAYMNDTIVPAIAQITDALTSVQQSVAAVQQAVATVAGYNTRMADVEGKADTNADNITALQGRMGTAEGNITALQNVQADYVKKAGAAQTVTSQIMVSTTATGLRDTQIANGSRIQNDLDAYEAMIRTTGNQSKNGILQLNNIGKGTIALATNLNVTNRAVKLGRASGYGIYRYGAAFVLIMCRDQLYLVRLTSGSNATLHNAIVTNLSTLTVVGDPSTLPFTMGYLETDAIYVVIKGTSGSNKLVTAYWFGGSQGGSTGLSLLPTINDEVTDDEVAYFWRVL